MIRNELDAAIRDGLSDRARDRYINCAESYQGQYHNYAIEHGLAACIALLEADATPEGLLSDEFCEPVEEIFLGISGADDGITFFSDI